MLEEEKAQLSRHLLRVLSSNQRGDEVHRHNAMAKRRVRRQGRALLAPTASATSHTTSTETLQHWAYRDRGAAESAAKSAYRPLLKLTYAWGKSAAPRSLNISLMAW